MHSGIGHGRKNDVKRHKEHDCHRTKVSALSRMSGGIARYVATGTEVDRATAAETMLANFIVKNNFLLTITDDFSKTVGKMLTDSDISKKFSAGRTMTTQIVKRALALENHDHPDHQGSACSREPRPPRSSRERLL